MWASSVSVSVQLNFLFLFNFVQPKVNTDYIRGRVGRGQGCFVRHNDKCEQICTDRQKIEPYIMNTIHTLNDLNIKECHRLGGYLHVLCQTSLDLKMNAKHVSIEFHWIPYFSLKLSQNVKNLILLLISVCTTMLKISIK